MNATTTRRDTPATPTRTGRVGAAPAVVPFAMLPHDIAADPRLSPTDVRVLLALVFYAKDKDRCRPSDPAIAGRIVRSVGTVQRSLRRLELFGLIARQATAETRVGRIILLRWRATSQPPATETPAAPAREGKRREGGERPSSVPGHGSPVPPAGEKQEDDVATPEDLARFRLWATGKDPALARFGRAALRNAGVIPDDHPTGGSVAGGGTDGRLALSPVELPNLENLPGHHAHEHPAGGDHQPERVVDQAPPVAGPDHEGPGRLGIPQASQVVSGHGGRTPSRGGPFVAPPFRLPSRTGWRGPSFVRALVDGWNGHAIGGRSGRDRGRCGPAPRPPRLE